MRHHDVLSLCPPSLRKGTTGSGETYSLCVRDLFEFTVFRHPLFLCSGRSEQEALEKASKKFSVPKEKVHLEQGKVTW